MSFCAINTCINLSGHNESMISLNTGDMKKYATTCLL